MIASIRRAATSRFSHLVLGLHGPDRLGLMNELCEKVVSPCQGVIGKSRLSVIGGDISLLAKVRLPQETADKVHPLMRELFPEFLITCNDAGVKDATQQRTQYRTFFVIGPDAAGILEKVSRFARDRHMDVVHMESEVISGSHVGHDIFKSDVTVSVQPNYAPDDTMLADLQALGDMLGVELTLSESFDRALDRPSSGLRSPS